MGRAMRILVTGAGGFVGRALVARLRGGAMPFERLTLLDAHMSDLPDDDRVRVVIGDIAEHAVRARALDSGVDVVFHLIGVSSAVSERDYALSRRVNLDATLSLFEEVARVGSRPRVVYTSSIAVFGSPSPDHVDDETPTEPALIYGAHKKMCEVALADLSRRREVDGIALRPAGVVARPSAGGGAGFLSDIFHAFLRNEPFVAPVSEHAHSWLISVTRCVDNLIHAAQMPLDAMPKSRALTMPALRVSIPELAAALARTTGSNADRVSYEPQQWIEATYGSYPPLATPLAERLGFRDDGDIGALVQAVLMTLRSGG